MSYSVQFFRYDSRGGYVCWPKIVNNDSPPWDPRSLAPGNKWTLDIDQSETVDLISDAGFKEGDIVTPWIDVEAGIDACANKVFVVANNGKTASFDASGTTLNTHLAYTGTA